MKRVNFGFRAEDRATKAVLRFTLLFLGAFVAVIAGTKVAKADLEISGTAAIAAGSINPPSPTDGCNRAKQDARSKAAAQGYKGSVTWKRLSNDNDCSLTTSGARGAGYYYIFTARGVFKK